MKNHRIILFDDVDNYFPPAWWYNYLIDNDRVFTTVDEINEVLQLECGKFIIKDRTRFLEFDSHTSLIEFMLKYVL